LFVRICGIGLLFGGLYAFHTLDIVAYPDPFPPMIEVKNIQPTISPWSAIAEVFRYELVGNGTGLTDLKSIQDWLIRRDFKRVPGVLPVLFKLLHRVEQMAHEE
jgi:Cu/Ag efflux pump CusA